MKLKPERDSRGGREVAAENEENCITEKPHNLNALSNTFTVIKS
jgi:hypothetical protein